MQVVKRSYNPVFHTYILYERYYKWPNCVFAAICLAETGFLTRLKRQKNRSLNLAKPVPSKAVLFLSKKVAFSGHQDEIEGAIEVVQYAFKNSYL